jgi:hypothetical protein
MSRRRLVYVALAIGLLVAGRFFGGSGSTRRPEGAAPAPTAFDAAGGPQPAVPLRHPPSAVAELGILTDRPQAELEALTRRDALGASLRPAYCGDEEACGAVRAALADERVTTLQIVAASDWEMDRGILDASAEGLAAKDRASISKRPRIVVVHVATAPSPRQLAVRAAFASTAAIAGQIDGLVYDALLGRIESARDFAAHAVTEPLAASAFRRDRVQMLYEPKAEGVVRILTAGLSRWGAPDVEAAAVPNSASARVAEIVLGVAEAIANGATAGPVTLSRDDLARVRGSEYPADAALPEAAPVSLAVVSVHPEAGDPNDFIARITPPAGDSPLGYLDLSERFFGPMLAAAPEGAALAARRAKAQSALASALARWDKARAKLLAQVPFEIAGEGGIESMWIEVTRYDARTVTGKLVDEPLVATQFSRGQEITRARGEVEDIEERGDGGR